MSGKDCNIKGENDMKYDFAAIEKKWQKRWEETKPYAAVTGDKRPKFYGLIEGRRVRLRR